MKSSTKVGKYIEAIRERDAFTRALADDPSEARQKRLKIAKEHVTQVERTLTGGELGAARRLLSAQQLEVQA